MNSYFFLNVKKILWVFILLVLCGLPQIVFSQISVSRPNEGDVYIHGQSIVINWGWTSSPPDWVNEVTVNLYRNGSLYNTNIARASKYQSYITWQIPDHLSTNGTYHVEVIGVGGGGRGSSGTFMIEDAYLSFNSGYDGRTIEAGESFSFSWNHNLSEGHINLFYSSSGGSGKINSNNISLSRKSYSWTPPSNVAGHTASIRIQSSAYPLQDYIRNIEVEENHEITVDYPSGGEQFRDGDDVTIKWNTNYNLDEVGIDLYKDGSLDHTIVDTNNDGSYKWSIDPADAENGSTFHIEVYELVGPGIRGEESDASGNFTIKRNELSVTGGSNTNVVAGEDHTITWDHNLKKGAIDLHYRNNSGNWEPIETGVSRSESSISWTTPSGSDYINSTDVRIRSTQYPHVVAYANNITFSKSISLISPESDAIGWGKGRLRIEWDANYLEGNINIVLLKGGNLVQVITSKSVEYGFHNWTIPTTIDEADDYQIKVSDGSLNSLSSNFTLKPYVVSNPAEGEVLYTGQNVGIFWNADFTGFDEKVDIRLYKEGFLEETLAEGLSNGGIWGWTVPEDLLESDAYHIEVHSEEGTIGISGIFSIDDIYLTFNSGQDGSTIDVDESLPINWEHNMTVGHIDLYYNDIDEGWVKMNNSEISLSQTSYSWSPPHNMIGSTTTIRVENPSYPSLQDNINNIYVINNKITVGYPAGGEEFRDGEDVFIEWDITYNVDEVGIDLYKDGFRERTIVHTDNNGFYSWTVDELVALTAEGSTFHLEVYEIVGPGQRGPKHDDSGSFTIKKNILEFNPGLEGKEIRSGDLFTVSWIDNLDKGKVLVEFKDDDSWHSLDEIDPGIGVYIWETPNWSGHAKLRISSTSYSTPADTLHNLELIRFLDVNNPKEGTLWGMDNTEQIYWESNVTQQQVNIELLDSDKNPIGLVAEGVDTYTSSNNGWFLWSIENMLPNGEFIIPDNNYFIRVATNNYDILGISGEFTITESDHVRIFSPSSGDGFQSGTEIPITFSTNVTSVDIDLLGPSNREIVSGLTTSPSELHSFNWNIPADLPDGAYEVRISGGTASVLSGTFHLGEGIVHRLVSYEDYDNYGNVLKATDANNYITNFTYTPGGIHLEKIDRQNPDGLSLTTEAQYNNLGLLEFLVDENGSSTHFEYDNFHRLEAILNVNEEPVTEFEYTYAGEQFSNGNPNFISNVTVVGEFEPDRLTVEYIDGLGRPIQTQQQVGSEDIIITTDYDGQGREWKSWKPYRRNTGHSYDADYATHANGYYDGSSGPDGNGKAFAEQLYEPSPLGRPSKTIPEGGEANSGAVATGYDVRSWNGSNYQVTTTTDEEGNQTETWSDGWGRTVRTIADPGGIAAETIFEYDALDNLTKVTAPNGLETTYTFDTRGNLVQKNSPDAGITRYKYDAAGNLRFSQDANQAAAGDVAYTTYDFAGRPLVEGVAEADFSTLDPGSNYPFESEIMNQKGVYAWDSAPDISGEPWSEFAGRIDAESVTNPKGNLAARAWRVDDGASSVIGPNPWQAGLYSYDDEGRVADKWTWTGDKSEWDTHLAYQYNRQGEVTRMKVTVGSETLYQHYEYDQRGLLANVYISTTGTQPSTPEITYSYTPTGAIDNIAYKGGREADYEYTIRDWVKSINNVETPGGNFAAFYDYTDNGNVEQAQFYNPDPNFDLPATHRHYHQGFAYDRLSRLTGADYGFGAAGSSAWFDVGNLSYDLAGNMESLRRADETGTLIDQLRYDYSGTSNRLQAVTDSSGIALGWDAESTSFGYDANGNLTSQSGKIDNIGYDHRNLPTYFNLSNGSEMQAAYNADGQRILKELKGEAWQFYVMDGQQTLAVIDNEGFRHFNLVGNDVFGRVDDSGARRYYLKDHLGSTRAVVDNSGEVLESFDYYPFGLLMPKRNTTGAGTMEKFTGKERDEAIGLDYFGARYYDPALGRWHNVDPLADKYPAWSPYNYTQNNPLLFIDPDGKDIVISYGCNDKGKNCSEFVFTGDNIDEARELDNKFVNQFLNAYEYAAENGGSNNLVEAATNRDLQIGLSRFDENNAQTQTGSYHLYGTVYWIPEGGLKTANGSVASPATVLEHEFTHAVEFSKERMGFSRRSKADREASAIRAENRAARGNGEIGPGQMLRSPYDHSSGHTVGTFGPTSNRIDRQKTYQYYKWLNQNTPFDVSKFLKLYGGIK